MNYRLGDKLISKFTGDTFLIKTFNSETNTFGLFNISKAYDYVVPIIWNNKPEDLKKHFISVRTIINIPKVPV